MTKRRRRGTGRIFFHGKSWWIGYYEQGKSVRVRLEGATKDEAETELKRRMARQALQTRQRVGLTTNHVQLSSLLEDYLADARVRLKPGTAQQYEEALRLILRMPAEGKKHPVKVPSLNVQWVDELSPVMITRYSATRIGSESSPRTVNIAVGALRTMLAWAERYGIIAHSPLLEVKPIRHRSPRQRLPLSDAQVDALLAASPRGYRVIWKTFLLTGLRLTELVELEWADVDFERAEIAVRAENAKSSRARRVPMLAELAEELQRLHDDGDGEGHVFLNHRGQPWRNNLLTRFKACLTAAKIAKGEFCLHSLRHTFATGLIRGGCDPRTAQEILGHADVRITLRIYTHVFPQDKRAAIERLAYLARPAAGGAGGVKTA